MGNKLEVVNKNVDKMEPPIEENVVKKEKSLTARILSSADLKDMMSGSSKGLPIKVPTIPIKVITSNASQPTTIPGVIVAKPSATSPASNLILKGKTIPLVLEKQPTNKDLPVSSTNSANSSLVNHSQANNAKVPNILRGTNSPSKNTIDRQVVSHEATIELKKNLLIKNANIVSVPKVVNGKPIMATSPSVIVPKAVDLLQPLNASTEVENPSEKENLDLSELNLKCQTNELGAIEIIKSPVAEKEEVPDKKENANEKVTDEIMDELMCKETVQPSPPAKEVKKKEPKVRDDDILCCDGCGCYGMAGEFFNAQACSSTCHSRILQRNREKEKKERELAVQKQRREQRKKEQKEAKEKLQKEIHETNDNENENMVISDADQDQESEIGDKLPFDSPHPWLDSQRGFSWSRYLECTNSRAAPPKLFIEAYPNRENSFRIGHKLEAIDPEHPAVICVATIVQIQGFRVLIHFDGYSRAYDFWENAGSPNLFPVGWCEAHKQKLFPPPGYEMFTWKSYLETTNSRAAPKESFPHFAKPPKSSELNGWKIGLKLEAVDRSNNTLVCVATVTNVMDGRVLIHFDGWELDYDYWVTPHSPYIHPKGWCAERGVVLNKPKGYRGDFTWERYLEETRSKSVPNWAFKSTKHETTYFKKGMKLEVVDKWNPIFVRVATITDVAMRQVKVHFDGWPHDSFDFWIEDDSPNLHPTNWCSKTGHPLLSPLTVEEVSYHMANNRCPTPGCRGQGHAKGYEFASHQRLIDCPYNPQNLETDLKPDRLKSMRRPSRTYSTDSDKTRLEIDEDPDPELGRGNRIRKKRKFFDDNNSEPLLNGINHKNIENLIRHDVFSPDHYVPNNDTILINDQENSAFLKPVTANLSVNQVKKWTPNQVGNFVRNVPRLNIELNNLEAKIVQEEIDGEAFLLMTQSDMVNLLGLKLGPAIKIFNALLLVKKSSEN